MNMTSVRLWDLYTIHQSTRSEANRILASGSGQAHPPFPEEYRQSKHRARHWGSKEHCGQTATGRKYRQRKRRNTPCPAVSPFPGGSRVGAERVYPT